MKSQKHGTDPVGAVMVVGAGIAGVQAALDLADAGFYVYMVEAKPAIGGVMAQLDKIFPTNDCSMCILSPKLVECGRHLHIEILAPAQVQGIKGEPGNFTVTVNQPARYIDMTKCIACGLCAQKCPKKVPDEFNQGLISRKAAYVLYPQAVPLKFAIDERRVQRVREAISPIPGKHNWEIIPELSSRLGYPMKYSSAEEIFDEMASLTPAYGGMSYPRLEAAGLCWPCPTPDHPGTQYLHKDRFTRGLGLFQAIDYRPPAESPDADYPFLLTTGQLFSHYLTGTMTRRCPTLHHENPEVFVEINPLDAERLQIESGEKIRASSRRGSIAVKARVSETVKPGVVFIPMHYLENAANRLTNAALAPITKTPEYKACAVNLGKEA